MRKLGAHVSISKGLVAALEKASAMGANCIQIFSSPPQSFVGPKFTDSDCEAFKTKATDLGISPIFIHACYLINLASEKETLRYRSIKSLVEDLRFGDKIGACGVIVHTGSHKGKGFAAALPVVVDSINSIFRQTHGKTKLLLEVASGGKGKVGSTGEELSQMCESVGSPQIGVCLDTAHLFAGGYTFDTPEKVELLGKMIQTTVGWESIECMHVNDSKVAAGSFRDRHENLGVGFVGTEALKLLLNSPHFDKLPLILETPGFDDKGPDKKNLDILKSLVE